MASLLGTSYLADIFYLAFKIPNLFRRVFAEGAMSSAFIPIFNQLKFSIDHSKTSADSSIQFPVLSEKDFMSLIAFSLGGVLLIFLFLTMFFAPEIVKFLFALKEDHDFLLQQENQTIWILRIMIPYLGLISFSALYQSILQSKKKFGIPASTPILFNLVLIMVTTILLFAEEKWYEFFIQEYFLSYGNIGDLQNPKEYFKVVILAMSVLLGGGVQLLYPWWYVRKMGFRLNFKIFLHYYNHPHLKKFFTLMIPVIFSSGVYQINVLLVDPIALSLEEGTVSFLFYANRLLELPLGIIGVSIATVSLPLFSKSSFEKDQSRFVDILKRTINLLFLSIPLIMFVSVMFYQEIVSLLFQFKNFGVNSVEKTAYCFLIYIWGLPAIFFYRIFNQVFFARNDTRTPFYSALLTLVSSLSLTIFLVSIFPEASSIALASTISSYLVLGYLLWKIQTKLAISILGFMWDRMRYYLKWSVLPICFSIVIYHIIQFQLIDWYQTFSGEFWTIKFFQLLEISIFALIFLLLYTLSLYWSREKETLLILGKIKSKVFK